MALKVDEYPLSPPAKANDLFSFEFFQDALIAVPEHAREKEVERRDFKAY